MVTFSYFVMCSLKSNFDVLIAYHLGIMDYFGLQSNNISGFYLYRAKMAVDHDSAICWAEIEIYGHFDPNWVKKFDI